MRRPWTAPEAPLDETGLDELDGLPVIDRLKRLERNDATTVVERRRIISLQRSQLMSVVALIVLAVAVGALYGKHLSANTRAIKKANETANAAEGAALTRSDTEQVALRQSQIQGCERSNERTRSDNLSHLDDFRFDTGTVALIKLALALPQAPNPGLTSSDELKAALATARFLLSLEAGARRKTWKAPIASCEAAVDHPAKNRLNPPVPFVVRMPPRSALVTDR